MGVSRGVSFESDDERVTGAYEGEPVRRGVGAYLVRSKTAYLFQIRLPKELGGGRGVRPIRIGLGACPAREARRIADLLAAEARRCFSEIRTRRLSECDEEKEPSNETAVESLFSGADPIEAVAEVRGYLKAVQQFVQVTPPAPTPSRSASMRAGADWSASLANSQRDQRAIR